MAYGVLTRTNFVAAGAAFATRNAISDPGPAASPLYTTAVQAATLPAWYATASWLAL